MEGGGLVTKIKFFKCELLDGVLHEMVVRIDIFSIYLHLVIWTIQKYGYLSHFFIGKKYILTDHFSFISHQENGGGQATKF